jgi:hypothetical protein
LLVISFCVAAINAPIALGGQFVFDGEKSKGAQTVSLANSQIGL